MPETLLSEGHMTFQSPCLILTSNPDTSFPPVRAIIRIGVLSVIFDQVRFRGLLGYIVIPGAVWILSLISEDNVTSECTVLLGQRSGFGGVSDSGFSSCAVPTY